VNKTRFFRNSDLVAFLATFLISLTVYILTLAPSVTMEDSGELIVAADYLGVPHPPGYPIWTLLTWVFQLLFDSVTFHGHPNPAWAVNLFSGFAGSAACGTLALLISRSGMDLLRSLKKESGILSEKTECLFSAAAGIAGGLLLAFAQGMWSQSVIAEVYSLNILFQSLVLLFLYRWVVEPEKPVWLLLCTFTFGLGITNHQTLMFMGLAIAVAVLFRNLKLCRDFIITGLFFVLMVALNKFFSGEAQHRPWSWVAGPEHIGFWFWTAYAILIPVIAAFTLPNGKVVGPAFLLMEAGLAFYLYMPLAAIHNPPMNWGYTCTWEGFIASITRGQYGGVTIANIFSARFLQQLGTYLMDLRSQFYWPIALLAAVPFFFCKRFGKREIAWMATMLIAFLSVGIVFIVLQNPKTDINNLFIGRVQYIQSHAVYAIWIGYGILLLMGRLATLARNHPITNTLGVVLVLLLPSALIYKNYNDEGQLRVVGGAEQNGHDFGWQFGHWQLQGVDGIKADLQDNLSPQEFEDVWANYPNPEYPPAMDTNAIFFGGTDPGRFIPTYMIYSAKVRPDIYLITQNALATKTYTNEIHDLYGEQVWTPSHEDNERAFGQFVQDIQTGKIPAGPNTVTKDGKIMVQGAENVMRINAYLTQMIFNQNQFVSECKTNEATRPPGSAMVLNDPVIDPQTGQFEQRSFYLEESSPMPWMYPYLTPHGLIMKINNTPTPLTEKHVRNDFEFWNWYCDYLLADKRFLRDTAARRSFSKLRTALAGMYAARNKPKEAEVAYRQALSLYDLNLESNIRLAMLLAGQQHFSEATALLNTLQQKDPNNEQIAPLVQRIESHKNMIMRLTVLEKEGKDGTMSFSNAIELAGLYLQAGQPNNTRDLGIKLLNSCAERPPLLQELAQHMVNYKQYDIAEQALLKYTEQAPKDPNGWLNLAAYKVAFRKYKETPDLIEQAIALGGEPIRNKLRIDKRFDLIRNAPEFQKLVPLRITNTFSLLPFPGS
jgi:tetratricopeptide (TPR) repeat protein